MTRDAAAAQPQQQAEIPPPATADTTAVASLTETPRLRTAPDWTYLLQEIYEMYRHSSAGGSAKIRSHQKKVRESLSKVLETNPALTFRTPELKPVCAHLKRALDRGRSERTESVVRAVESVTDQLVWVYGYEKLRRSLAEKYAFAEILGPNGPVLSDKLILGLVLFAPRCTYPTHSHTGITESYFCLSGSVSENDNGVYTPGSLIYNPPDNPHRITVGDYNPTLLVYAWVGAPEMLSGQRMTFSRKSKRAAKPLPEGGC